MDYKKEVQVRLRVESIFNKTEEEFPSKEDYNDYLEEREDIIFNLIEGIDTKKMEAKIQEYRIKNAESIGRNEAKKAEEIRLRASQADSSTAHQDQHRIAADKEGVSGSAAAFHGGADAEPHQGMEYTVNIPSGTAMATAIPLAAIPSTGDLPRASGDQTKEQWKAMAVSSGWSPDFQRKKALEAFLGSLRALKTFI